MTFTDREKQQILQRARECGLLSGVSHSEQISIRLSAEMIASLEALAQIMGTNRSALIASFVEQGVASLLIKGDKSV